MKKKQSKKKTQNRKKKNISEKTVFANLEKPTNSVTTPKRSSSGIPKYVADRMARRIFFTAGIPTILGMSVFMDAKNQYYFLLKPCPLLSHFQYFLVEMRDHQ